MVKAKKHLGQHFLTDKQIAADIVGSLTKHGDYHRILEIGPGTGVLTDILLQNSDYELVVIDVDSESIQFLHKKYPQLGERIIEGDFLEMNFARQFPDEKVALIGNLPYNISSQIFFQVLEIKDQIPEVVCMLQKEVAERLASPPGKRDSGILSVFLHAYYDIEYLFTVGAEVFDPPPKVQSGVIRLKRNEVNQLDCDEKAFRRVVKQGFNNRRKTLRNALKPLDLSEEIKQMEILDKRAEALTVADFVYLTNLIYPK